MIVLAGTKNILAEQTRRRLENDLSMRANPGRPWRSFYNPSSADLPSFRGLLRTWDAPDAPVILRKTIVASVLKNPVRLQPVAEMLARLAGENLLGSVLVIDDEADQAGLNTQVRQGRQSPTYRAIGAVRNALPAHTYLQYTATPQGNLLIPLLDLLSPDFAAVLQPGAGYVGGADLFVDAPDCVETIPAGDIGSPDAPQSLHRALRLFFVGVADWIAKGCPSAANRSMMVHPSHLVDSHNVYERWIRSRVRDWERILLDADSPDRPLVVEEFRDAHADLARTVQDLHPLEHVLRLLPHALQLTDIRVVNSEQDIDIPWEMHPSWLLVGGANLDRGFTVEGLTVTYMPRGPGVGNADTIQQRGRFFGYKRGYLGYCRVFLKSDVNDAFAAYVRHERSIHDWLARCIAQGITLRELPRRFLIDPALRPTRAQILTTDVTRASVRHEWFRQYSVLESLEYCQANLEAIERFVRDRGLALVDDEPVSLPDQRTAHQRHKVANVPLRDLYEGLLVDMRIPGAEDRQRWLAALYLIERWIESSPEDGSMLVKMRPGLTTARKVEDGELENPFQGAHPDRDGRIYPGDQRIRGGAASLQLHIIDLHDGPVATAPRIASAVPVIALWLADPLRTDDQILLERRP